MVKSTYEKPEDETELTQHIASALDQYIEGGFARACTVGIKRQDQSSLARSEIFPDLVKRLDESRILSLEVKVRHSSTVGGLVKHRFKSFDAKQRKIYEVMYACNVPIFYCYNAGDKLHELLSGEQILRSNKASEPKLVCDENGVVELYDQHRTLLEVIQKLKSGSIGRKGKASDVIFPFIAGENTSRLGIRRLILAYNIPHSQYEIYDDDYV